MYEDKKAEIDKKFNELKDRQNQLIAQSNQIEQELLRLQGEYRLLEQLGEEATAEAKPQTKGKRTEE
jgi:hypothetical protein